MSSEEKHDSDERTTRHRARQWTSLEVAKIAVAFLVPMSVAYAGHLLASSSDAGRRAYERDLEANRREFLSEMETGRQTFLSSLENQRNQHLAYSQLIARRGELWTAIAPLLNDIYVYFYFVGHWKTLSASDVTDRKRQLESVVYANIPYFSTGFRDAVAGFLSACFKEFGGGWAEDAPLRTSLVRPRDIADRVPAERFTGEDDQREMFDSYWRIMDVAARELNTGVEAPVYQRRSPD